MDHFQILLTAGICREPCLMGLWNMKIVYNNYTEVNMSQVCMYVTHLISSKLPTKGLYVAIHKAGKCWMLKIAHLGQYDM